MNSCSILRNATIVFILNISLYSCYNQAPNKYNCPDLKHSSRILLNLYPGMNLASVNDSIKKRKNVYTSSKRHYLTSIISPDTRYVFAITPQFDSNCGLSSVTLSYIGGIDMVQSKYEFDFYDKYKIYQLNEFQNHKSINIVNEYIEFLGKTLGTYTHQSINNQEYYTWKKDGNTYNLRFIKKNHIKHIKPKSSIGIDITEITHRKEKPHKYDINNFSLDIYNNTIKEHIIKMAKLDSANDYNTEIEKANSSKNDF